MPNLKRITVFMTPKRHNELKREARAKKISLSTYRRQLLGDDGGIVDGRYNSGFANKAKPKKKKAA